MCERREQPKNTHIVITLKGFWAFVFLLCLSRAIGAIGIFMCARRNKNLLADNVMNRVVYACTKSKI